MTPNLSQRLRASVTDTLPSVISLTCSKKLLSRFQLALLGTLKSLLSPVVLILIVASNISMDTSYRFNTPYVAWWKHRHMLNRFVIAVSLDRSLSIDEPIKDLASVLFHQYGHLIIGSLVIMLPFESYWCSYLSTTRS